MRETNNYGLTLFDDNDVPGWLTSWNDNMTTLDTALADIMAAIPSSVNLQPIYNKLASLNANVNKNTEDIKNLEFIPNINKYEMAENDMFIAPKTGWYIISAVIIATIAGNQYYTLVRSSDNALVCPNANGYSNIGEIQILKNVFLQKNVQYKFIAKTGSSLRDTKYRYCGEE